VTLQAAGSSGSPLRFDGEVFITCERGEITLDIGGQDHSLRLGDTAHFKASHAFTYRNNADGPARFLLAATLPPELRSVLEAHATSIGAGGQT
jgi:quercetin dioxygenase-like cupin family protein